MTRIDTPLEPTSIRHQAPNSRAPMRTAAATRSGAAIAAAAAEIGRAHV